MGSCECAGDSSVSRLFYCCSPFLSLPLGWRICCQSGTAVSHTSSSCQFTGECFGENLPKAFFFLPRLNTLHLPNICSRCWPREPHKSSQGDYLTVILTSINVFFSREGNNYCPCSSGLPPWIKIMARSTIYGQVTLRRSLNFCFSL